MSHQLNLGDYVLWRTVLCKITAVHDDGFLTINGRSEEGNYITCMHVPSEDIDFIPEIEQLIIKAHMMGRPPIIQVALLDREDMEANS